MLIGGLLALLIGGLASLALSVPSFGLAVLLVIGIGGLMVALTSPGVPNGFSLLIVCLAASQVGYGLGLATLAALRGRRRQRPAVRAADDALSAGRGPSGHDR